MEKASNADGNSTTSQRELRFIEFYSGVGGWTAALQLARTQLSDICQLGLSLKCCAALDHSDLCTSVYQHNHPCSDAHVRQYRIDELSSKQLNLWKADVWLMSPPCQPHTRQHSNQTNDLVDARSASFLHLVQLLTTTETDEEAIPSIILLENVVGFELSNSFQKFCQALALRDYRIAHFILEPTQFGFPNDRPRYYCVAIRNPSDTRSIIDEQSALCASFHRLVHSDVAIQLPDVRTAIPILQVDSQGPSQIKTISEFLTDLSLTEAAGLCVSPELMTKTAAWCFDIVTPASTRSACFTSGYARFIRGTGSILYIPKDASGQQMELLASDATFHLQDPQDREYESDWIQRLNIDTSCLRYFSGTEMARLLGFPASFSFPPDMPLKQQWKLMGNSLNVGVAKHLIELALQVVKFR